MGAAALTEARRRGGGENLRAKNFLGPDVMAPRRHDHVGFNRWRGIDAEFEMKVGGDVDFHG